MTPTDAFATIGDAFYELRRYGADDWHGEAVVWKGRLGPERIFVDGATAEDVLREMARRVSEARGA